MRRCAQIAYWLEGIRSPAVLNFDGHEVGSYFLGLRPLAGYASLKVYHVMSCFLHEKRSVCYDMAG